MAHYPEAARVALLNWINTFKLRQKVQSLDELTDGLVFGEVLEEVLEVIGGRDRFDSEKLNRNAFSTADKRENLEKVWRSLAALIREDNPNIAPSPSQFRAIAENPDDDGMCEFITHFLVAACLGPKRDTWVPTVMDLGKKDMRVIGTIMQERDHASKQAKKTTEPDEPNKASALDVEDDRDVDLAREELFAQKEREIKQLKDKNADLNSRLDSLKAKHLELNHVLRQTQSDLESIRETGCTTSDLPSMTKRMEQEKQANGLLIDQLQSQLSELEIDAARLRRENAVLSEKASRLADVQDHLAILQHQLKDAEKTERVLENYKKKAHESTTYQQQIRELQAKNDNLQELLAESDRYRMLCQDQQQVLEAFRESQGKYEATLHEQDILRANLQDSLNDLRAQVERYDQRHQMEEARIRDLEEKLIMGAGAMSSSETAPSSPGFSLEQELATSTDPTTMYRLELSRLKAENEVLRNNMPSQAEAHRIRSELDRANRKNDHLTTQYSEVVEKHTVAQAQIGALVAAMPADKDKAFVVIRSQLVQTTEELKQCRDRIFKLEALVADKDREITEARTDLQAVGKDSLEALEILKSSDQLVSAGLKLDLEATRVQLEKREFDLEQLKKQLMEALVSKDKLRGELDTVRAEVASGAVPAAAAAAAVSGDAEKNERLRAALKLKKQQLEKAEQDKYELERKLKATESGTALAAQKAASDQVIKNLQRENAMITTAWYDLTSRLQSNHVILQRRQDVPRSWLNKQRQLVNATPRR